MLIRKSVLEQIKSGRVTLAFRRWRRPSVKAGGSLKTAVGLLSITEVGVCEESDITNHDARQAGYEDVDALLDELNGRAGTVYRIRLAYAGADPRITLREDADLAVEDLRAITEKLQRLDKASRRGDWTLRFLKLVGKHPMLPAGELAAKAGVEKDWLKTNIRKLKNLGLTISHQPGYELAPRGHAYLKRRAEGEEKSAEATAASRRR